ncbi:MAG: class I adenylate-forming enzyme family protein [Acidimicrobiales bacterium]
MSCTELADLIVRRAREDGGGVAFVEGATGRARTWSQLCAGIEEWETAASALGTGGRVGLMIGDPLAMVEAFLAAVASGWCVAPLDPAAPPAELGRRCVELDLTGVVSDGSVPLAAGVPPRGPDAAGFAAAVVLASSGTTGTPKLVPLSTDQLLHTARSVIAAHGLGPADVGYCPLPLFHINALVVGVLTTVVSGSTLVVDRRFSAGGFWATIERERVTWMNLVPAIISILAGRGAPDPAPPSRIRFARSASAPLAVATLTRFETVTGIPVVETYGMTEAASQITATAWHDRRPGSAGRAVGCELRVVDPRRHPIRPGETGEIEIRGDAVVVRYWAPAGEQPPSRPATHPDGWLSTGDLGRLDGDGYVYLVGRLDDVINRGGEKIHPREVEEVLLREPDVAATAVVGRPAPTVGEEPVAFVTPVPGCTDPAALAARLVARCEKELSRYKRPAAITLAERLPAGPTGKIRRVELRRAAAGSLARVP